MTHDRADQPPSDGDSSPKTESMMDRRKLLKTAGLGLAATAGALAAAGPASAHPVDDAPLRLPQLIEPAQPAVPIPLTDTAAVCGVKSTTPLKANQIEVAVPASRELIVRRIPDELLPVAEVSVRVSRQILTENKRQMMVACPSPVIAVEV